MFESFDVKTEVRRLAASKPVCAAAGAGVTASHALRDLQGKLASELPGVLHADLPGKLASELPGEVARWRHEAAATVSALPGHVASLPTTVGTLPGRAADAVTTAVTAAAHRYDTFADRGRKVLTQANGTVHKRELNGKASTGPAAKTRTSKARQTKTQTKTGTNHTGR